MNVASTGSDASSTWWPSESSRSAVACTDFRVSSSVGTPVTESTITPIRRRADPGPSTSRIGGCFGLR